MKIAIAAVVLVFMLATSLYAEFQCGECHSKDPKLKRMHEALQFKGCPKCHVSRSEMKFTDEAKANRGKDPRCIPCHDK